MVSCGGARSQYRADGSKMFGKWFRRKRRSSPSSPPVVGDLADVPGLPAVPAVPRPSRPADRGRHASGSSTPAVSADFGPRGLEGYAKNLDGHRHVIQRDAPVRIGRAALRPPEALLREMSRQMTDCGATTVYWFWMSVAGDEPHLGLAVAPNDDTVVRKIGEAIEPLWKQFNPDNPIFDILRLGSESDAAIKNCGELLVPWPSSSSTNPPAS